MPTSGSLLREARLRAGLTQTALCARTGANRAQITLWEHDEVAIGFGLLRTHLHACGFDIDLTLIPHDPDLDSQLDEELEETINLSPKERVERNQTLRASSKKKR